MVLRALVAAQQRNGKMVPGASMEDAAIGFQKLLADHGIRNRAHFLNALKFVKELFDDAEDGGSGRTTVFLFPSEVEAEMKNGGTLKPGKQLVPSAPRPALIDEHGQPFEELEEPGG